MSSMSVIFAVGFFIMATFWLWHVEDRESDQVSSI
jgi:predicted outer membrane lipoprotein